MSFRRVDTRAGSLNFEVRRSKRAKRIVLRAKPSGLVVTLPWRARLVEADRAVLESEAWVREALLRAAPPHHGQRVPVEGVWLDVVFAAEPELTETAVFGPTSGAIERLLRNRARALLTREVHEFAPIVGRRPTTVRLSSAKGRWGSCSTRGSINLNWKLILVPSPERRYVVVHELAHLLQPNHSRAFWAEVERVTPDWKRRRDTLRDWAWVLDYEVPEPQAD